MLSALPKVIRRYRARYPAVDFTLRELSTSAIADAIESGSIDLGFLREARPSDALASELILREPVAVVMPSSHRLAKRARFHLRDLAREPFVLFPRRLGPAFYDQFIAFCTQAGFSPTVVQEATQWQSIVAIVEAGVGVSLVPDCVRKVRWPGVVFRPLPALTTSVSLCWKKGPLTPTMQAFLTFARAGFTKSAII